MRFLKLLIITILLTTTSSWAKNLTGPQKNAVRSAKNYLAMTGFSRDGLIQQLSSDAGDKYTVSQSKYGAQEAGACQ